MFLGEEYRPEYTYSRRQRSVARRLTPAGWLAIAVGIAAVALGVAALASGLANREREWGTGTAVTPETQALVVAGPGEPEAAASGVAPTPTVQPTATPEGGVWWADAMTEANNGALVPPEAVQEQIVEAWEAYWANVNLPLAEFVALTEEDLVERFSATPAQAERVVQNIASKHYDKYVVTGRILVVTGERVNLRAGPGTIHETVGEARAGTRLALLEEKTGTDGKLWYRGWLMAEGREAWVASWLVEAKDNYWPYPHYEEREIQVHDCAADGLTCIVTDVMRDGGAELVNLRTAERLAEVYDVSNYPAVGIRVQARMIYDKESERWLCDGIEWEKLTEDE
ncbi:MAG: hypothetical protein Kow00120_15250 [Anaerolineae bacterium]